MYIKPEIGQTGTLGNISNYRVVSASKIKDGEYKLVIQLKEGKVSFMDKLQGKKTYIVALVTVVYAGTALYLGKMDFAEFVNYLILAGGMVGFRSALNK